MLRILQTGSLLILFLGSMVHAQTRALPRSHSHNNYLQANSLDDALKFGFISVEADILWKDEQMYVGHDRIDLETKPLVTLEHLYLDPLFKRFLSGNGNIYEEYEGLFYLWIDIKYSGDAVCKALMKRINQYKPMLYSRKENPVGKVMLIISGDRPIDLIRSSTEGFLHLDGRPEDLGTNINSERMTFISEHIGKMCPATSNGFLDAAGIEKMTSFVAACHAEGKRARLWATPENATLWKQLIAADMDLINTDSIKKYADFIYAP